MHAKVLNVIKDFEKSTSELSDAGFMAKLELFLAMAGENCFDFDLNTAENAVKEYLKDGIRPTSHTKVYHRHYAPAYRVVKK